MKLYNISKFFSNRGLYRLSKAIYKIADIVDLIQVKGFKFALWSFVWDILHRLDKGESCKGETAPYCGFHYSGFENKYLKESYHEGDGGGTTKFSILGYYLCYEYLSTEVFYLSKIKC